MTLFVLKTFDIKSYHHNFIGKALNFLLFIKYNLSYEFLG